MCMGKLPKEHTHFVQLCTTSTKSHTCRTEPAQPNAREKYVCSHLNCKTTSFVYKSWSAIKLRLLKTICLVQCYQNVWCSLVTFGIWSQQLLSNQTKLQEVSNTCLLQTRLLSIFSLQHQTKCTGIDSFGLERCSLSLAQCLLLLSWGETTGPKKDSLSMSDPVISV